MGAGHRGGLDVLGRFFGAIGKHVLNRHFLEGIEFGVEALGAVGLGIGVVVLGGTFGWIPGVIIIAVGGAALRYTAYRSFREAFEREKLEKRR